MSKVNWAKWLPKQIRLKWNKNELVSIETDYVQLIFWVRTPTTYWVGHLNVNHLAHGILSQRTHAHAPNVEKQSEPYHFGQKVKSFWNTGRRPHIAAHARPCYVPSDAITTRPLFNKCPRGMNSVGTILYLNTFVNYFIRFSVNEFGQSYFKSIEIRYHVHVSWRAKRPLAAL